MRAPIITLLTVTILLGCAYPVHHFTIHPRDSGENGQGIAQGVEKTVTINLNGRTYSGVFILDSGKVTTSNTFESSTAYSGTNSATAYGSGFGSTYVPGSGNGKLLATSPDGDAVRCEFQINPGIKGKGLGACQDNSGKQYDMLILD